MSYILVAIADEEFTNYHLLPPHAQTLSLIDKLNSAATNPNVALANEILEEIREFRFRFWHGESPEPIVMKPVYKMYFFSSYF